MEIWNCLGYNLFEKIQMRKGEILMAILVTGGAGYTGSHVCIELLKQGYEVVIVDNFLTSTADAIKDIREKTGKNIKLYAMDLGHKELVERIFSENDIEGVIHFAGIKSTGDYKKNPIQYYYTNLASTLMLCEVMGEHHVKKMVFSSSEGFYGDNGSDTTTYGSAKLMIEKMLHEVYLADPEWSIKVIRYLTEEDHVYTKKNIKVEDMSRIYIDAFKTIAEGKIETYRLEIENHKINVSDADDFRGYQVKDLSMR